MQGSTDTYSYHQTELIASNNKWGTRPILQSYSAYTPDLVEKNRSHLLSVNAPDNIIFRVEPTDGRVPSMEDGASWPVLMFNYDIASTSNNFLFLKRKSEKVFDGFLKPLSFTNASLGSAVVLPDSNDPIFVKIHLKQTSFGKVVSILYKPTRLEILFNLEDGSIRKYRLIAGMAKSGILLSPLIENTTDFKTLFHLEHLETLKRVLSFEINPVGGKSRFWSNTYEVEFISILKPRKSKI